MHSSTLRHSIEWRWALTTAAAFALTIAAHEFAHIAVRLAARPITPAYRSLASLAGPVASLMIVAMSVLWMARREQSSRASRWAIALGLTAAVRVFMVWLLAGPWLLGLWPRVTFDERRVAAGLGVSVVAMLTVETVLAVAGTAWLIRRIPSGERREALLGISGVIALVGIVALLLNPRV